ncbi:PKD domain-containing protein [Pseudoalteromonas piratica]|uniref:PKD domain-containing protein n=1 Tax=Pseudoalteromonas piratica TaxID=1348114 RepID=UPI00068CF969|nr:PQQ-binding-like beta-propeller repeat protein [Pseudoalteromonas piratica]
MTLYWYLKSFFCTALVCLLAACGDNSSEDAVQVTEQNISKQLISGKASKGALNNAVIEAWAINKQGGITGTAPVATTTTDDRGNFTFNLVPQNEPLLLKSYGGSYIDESDPEPNINLKRSIQLTEQQGLTSILLPGETTSAMTIMTSSLTLKAQRETFGDVFFETLLAIIDNAEQTFGFNPFTNLPSNVISPATEDSQVTKQHALVIGGFANVVNHAAIDMGFPFANYLTIEAIISDFSDGKIDGLVNQNEIIVTADDGVLLSLSQTIDLNAEINRFRNNNFAAYETTPLLTVDQESLSEQQSVNFPPAISINEQTTGSEGEQITIVANVTDPEEQTLTLIWTQVAGPQVELIDNNTSAVSFSLENISQNQTITLQLEATDSVNATSKQTTSIQILNLPNQSPTANAGADQTVDEGSAVILSGEGSDNDGTIVSFLWQQTAGTEVELTNIQSANTQFEAPQLLEDEVLSFTLTVTDNEGATSSDSVSITVNNIPNQLPLVNAGGDQTVNEKDNVTLSGTASDNDGVITNYLWQQNSGPTVLLNNANSALANFIAPEVTSSQVLSFKLTVTDDQGATASDDVIINVNNVPNQPPIANAGTNQTVTEGDNVSLTGSGTDSDGDVVSYFWQQTAGETVSLTNPNAASTMFTAPQVTSTAILRFSLIVTDNEGATGTDDIVITVNDIPNEAPTVNAGSDQTVDEGNTVTLSCSATDNDGTIESYLWQQTAGETVSLTNPNAASTTFTAPEVTSTAILRFSLVVTDNEGATGTDDIVITVNDIPNEPPTVNAGSDQTVDEGNTVTLSGSANDNDGTIESYLWQQTAGETVSLTNPNAASTTFTAPEVTSTAILRFSLIVTDNEGATGTDDIVITLNDIPNEPPTVNAGSDQTVDEGNTVTLSGSATDNDGTIESYLWQQTAGPNVTLNNASSSTASFIAPDVESTSVLTFSLTVTDDKGDSASDDINITVSNVVNIPPTADAGRDQNVNEGSQVTLSGTGTDSDGSISSYLWQQTSGTTVSISNANSSNASFIAPEVSTTSSLEFRLTVTDDDGDSGSDFVTVVVNSVNKSPTANAGNDFTAGSGQEVVVLGSGTDPDGSIVAYRWQQLSGTNVTLINDNTEKVSFTAPFDEVVSTIELELTVTDNEDASAKDTVVITIDPSVGKVAAEVRWYYETDGPIVSEPVIDAKNNILVASQDHYLYSLSPDGALNWRLNGEASLDFSPLIASNNVIYITTNNNSLLAIKPDGELLWQFNLDETVSQSPIELPDKTIVVTTTNSLYAVNQSGELIWQHHLPAANISTALNQNDNLFITTDNGSVFALSNVVNQAVKTTEYFVSYAALNAPHRAKQQMHYLSDQNGAIYHLINNQIEQIMRIDAQLASAPLVLKNNLFIGTLNGRLYAYDLEKEMILWHFDARNPIQFSPLIAPFEELIITTQEGQIYALNKNGEVIWQLMLPSKIGASAIVSDNAIIYVGALDNKLYAIGREHSFNNQAEVNNNR